MDSVKKNPEKLSFVGTAEIGLANLVPKGRLNLAQHAVLGRRLEQDQSRRDG
jgi:hypothetical protein